MYLPCVEPLLQLPQQPVLRQQHVQQPWRQLEQLPRRPERQQQRPWKLYRPPQRLGQQLRMQLVRERRQQQRR